MEDLGTMQATLRVHTAAAQDAIPWSAQTALAKGSCHESWGLVGETVHF